MKLTKELLQIIIKEELDDLEEAWWNPFSKKKKPEPEPEPEGMSHAEMFRALQGYKPSFVSDPRNHGSRPGAVHISQKLHLRERIPKNNSK